MTVEVVERQGERPAFVNMSGLPNEALDGKLREVASSLTRWITEQRSTGPHRSTLFDRSAYMAPDNVYDQMKIARNALANDDVVSGACEVTSGLMWQGIKWESEEPDDADIFNQISKTLNLDNFVRQAHRELFATSQVVVATWWGWKEYTVRGRSAPPEQKLEKKVDPATGQESYEVPRDPETNQPQKRPKGVKRKRKYRVWAPLAISILDSLKIVPIGNTMWGRDRLAWQATKEEMAAFFAGADPTMETLFIGQYTPPEDSDEEHDLIRQGVDIKRLLELNPAYVFRHCVTRPDYQRWTDVRLKSVFKLLDLKQQLMESDRVALIGASNYILLVKKGTKEDPAYPEEIANLRENFNVLAKLPVIVSDHRLEIEIIVPAQDYVLEQEKYDLIDRRILARLLGAMSVASAGQRNESTLTTGRMVARLLESERHMLKRTLEHKIANAIVEHPLNDGKFEAEPNLAFTPRNVQLDADQQITQAVLAMRTQKELSRESLLEYFGFDQAVEAQRREYEEESGLDDVFGTAVPFDSPLNANAGGTPPPQITGAQGGRPSGGGSPPANATRPRPKNSPAKKAGA